MNKRGVGWFIPVVAIAVLLLVVVPFMFFLSNFLDFLSEGLNVYIISVGLVALIYWRFKSTKLMRTLLS